VTGHRLDDVGDGDGDGDGEDAHLRQDLLAADNIGGAVPPCRTGKYR
jgi:hypothetical protein